MPFGRLHSDIPHEALAECAKLLITLTNNDDNKIIFDTVQHILEEKMQNSQTRISSLLTNSPNAGTQALIDGPITRSTWADARTLMLVGVTTLLVKSDQAASLLNWLSGPSGFKPKMVPVLISMLLLYFLLVFLAHAVTDLITWWPTWREVQAPHKKTSRVLAAFVAIRFALECGVPLVFAILALQ